MVKVFMLNVFQRGSIYLTKRTSSVRIFTLVPSSEGHDVLQQLLSIFRLLRCKMRLIMLLTSCPPNQLYLYHIIHFIIKLCILQIKFYKNDNNIEKIRETYSVCYFSMHKIKANLMLISFTNKILPQLNLLTSLFALSPPSFVSILLPPSYFLILQEWDLVMHNFSSFTCLGEHKKKIKS